MKGRESVGKRISEGGWDSAKGLSVNPERVLYAWPGEFQSG